MKQKNILFTGLDPLFFKTEGNITHIPFIRIIPNSTLNEDIKKSLNDFLKYSHILMTSKNSVKILVKILPIFGFTLSDWQAKETICVGAATARSLLDISIHPTIIAKEETAEGIIEELKTIDLRKSILFWPHSAKARTLLNDFFNERSIPFAHCELYDTKPALLHNLPNLELFDEIVFTSPSTVHAFLHFFGNLPHNKIITCIGPITKKAIENIKKNITSACLFSRLHSK
jgi:uroporphyrinogen-III synthase